MDEEEETPCDQFHKYLNADEEVFSSLEVQQWFKDHLEGCQVCDAFLKEDERRGKEFFKPITDQYRHLPPAEKRLAIERDERIARAFLLLGWKEQQKRRDSQ